MALFLRLTTTVANTVGDSASSVANCMEKYVSRAFSSTGTIVSSAGLGMVGGMPLAMGGRIGCFQGTCQGALYSFILRPIGTCISDHTGNGKDQFNDNARRMLYLCGTIANFAIPTLLTVYYGKTAMTTLASYTGRFGWIFLPTENATVSIIGSLAVNILPSAISLLISTFTYIEKKDRINFR